MRKADLGQSVNRVRGKGVERGSALILVPLHASQIHASGLREHITESHRQGVGKTPRQRRLATHAVSEGRLLLDDEDAKTGSREDPGEHRAREILLRRRR